MNIYLNSIYLYINFLVLKSNLGNLNAIIVGDKLYGFGKLKDLN